MDLKNFRTAIEALPEEIGELKKQEKELHDKRRALEVFNHALAGLRRDWRHERYGKYGSTWFFVTDLSLDEGEDVRHIAHHEKKWVVMFVDSAEDLKKGKRVGYAPNYRYAEVPTCEMSEVSTHECGSCNETVRVIGRYTQTEDGPCGDTWVLKVMTLCFDCKTAGLIGRNVYNT